jgi:hypothetical protein
VNTILDLLILRQPRLIYVCPPICEALFSSTGGPTIILNPFTKKKVRGLVFGGHGGNVVLRWDAIPGVICYTIYRALDSNDPFGAYEIVAECINDDCDGVPCYQIVVDGCYRVSAITPDGETELSDPICTCCPTGISDIQVIVN